MGTTSDTLMGGLIGWELSFEWLRIGLDLFSAG